MTFGRVTRVSDTRIDVRADNGARYTNVLLPAGSTVSVGDRVVLAWDTAAKRWICLGIFAVSTASPVDTHSHSWTELTGKPNTFPPANHDLRSHTDVDTASPTDGQVLTWNAAAGQWQAADSSGGDGSGTDSRLLSWMGL